MSAAGHKTICATGEHVQVEEGPVAYKPIDELNDWGRAAARDFLADIKAVYAKHGLALGHEDHQGAFIIVPLDQHHEDWLDAAFAEVKDEPEQPTW